MTTTQIRYTVSKLKANNANRIIDLPIKKDIKKQESKPSNNTMTGGTAPKKVNKWEYLKIQSDIARIGYVANGLRF